MEQIDSRTSQVSDFPISQHKYCIRRTFRNRQGGAPLVSENVEADAAVGVDIGVIDAGGEVDLWGLEGVVGREMDSQEEDTASIRGLALICLSATVFGFGCWCSGFGFGQFSSCIPANCQTCHKVQYSQDP